MVVFSKPNMFIFIHLYTLQGKIEIKKDPESTTREGLDLLRIFGDSHQDFTSDTADDYISTDQSRVLLLPARRLQRLVPG